MPHYYYPQNVIVESTFFSQDVSSAIWKREQQVLVGKNIFTTPDEPTFKDKEEFVAQ